MKGLLGEEAEGEKSYFDLAAFEALEGDDEEFGFTG